MDNESIIWTTGSYKAIKIINPTPHIIELTNKIKELHHYRWIYSDCLNVPKEDRVPTSFELTIDGDHLSRFITGLKSLGNQEIDHDYLEKLLAELKNLINLLDVDTDDGIELMAGILDGTRKRYTVNEDIVRFMQQERAIERARQYGRAYRKLMFEKSKMLPDLPEGE